MLKKKSNTRKNDTEKTLWGIKSKKLFNIQSKYEFNKGKSIFIYQEHHSN